MLDSLNRHYLPLYGGTQVRTPNIERLAERGVVFENHFCCSMPCMPARRDLFTGHANFLETPWSPIQPWDNCLQPALNQQCGVYSHLITDHYHYFHAGGECYHNQFSSWEFLRGQESDVWRPLVDQTKTPPFIGKNTRPYWANRYFMNTENDEDYSTPQCFMRAIDFLEHNGHSDQWHLHLECFDPHEPFACPKKYRDEFNDTWDEKELHFDWPDYAPVEENEDAIKHIRACYAGTLRMADFWLGKLLDKIDKLNLWQDTVIVLSTDHGHLLGEHGYWAKNYMFDFKELVHIPLVICSPAGSPRRSSALTSTLDLMPTFMELHHAETTEYVHGKSLCPLLEKEDRHHDALLYGYFGKDVNLTDGHYTYCRQPEKFSTVHHHTAMPVNFAGSESRKNLTNADMGPFLKSANGIPHYRFSVPSKRHHNAPDYNPIYDITIDPDQAHPLQDKTLENKLAKQMYNLLQRYDAPECQYNRLGF
jgi:arylsulfatase A-like enzyme